MEESMPVGNTSTLAKPGSRLRELGLVLPEPPSPLGAYVEASQVRALLFLPEEINHQEGTYHEPNQKSIVHSTTGGRESGVSRSSDGRLDVKLSTPDASGTGTNPEQLLAAGWSACFVSSIKIVAARMKIMLPADLAVDAEVDLGTTGGAYFLQARLNVRLPGLEREVAQALVDGAHETCPYTKATRDNISVVTNVVEPGSVTVAEYLLTPWEVAG
jgi:osmotically inducible protein OsmC